MRYMKQLGIIFLVTCIGELLKYFIPLPIPGSIYGLVLMIILLMTKVIKLEQVKETGEFLIEIMPVMFIPAGVGVVVSWGQLKGMLVPVCAIVLLTTVLVMVVTGKVTDYFVAGKEKENHESDHS